MAEEIVVFVTCPREESEALAKSLVEDRLAACVNIVAPVKSIYVWQGKLTTEEESWLVIKSSKRIFSKLAQRIKQLHSYEVPEIIALPIADGHKPYLDWLNASLTQQGPSIEGS